jgi:hypothetical protein
MEPPERTAHAVRRRALLVAATLTLMAGAAAATLALQGDDGRSLPTEAQARAALDRKYREAQAGDGRVYCADTWTPDMCESQWDRLGGQAAVPRTPPRVAEVREQDGYRVLRVCGTDGRGQSYRTDFVVGLDEGKLALILPVFWNGATFSGVHGDDAPPKVEGARTA